MLDNGSYRYLISTLGGSSLYIVRTSPASPCRPLLFLSPRKSHTIGGPSTIAARRMPAPAPDPTPAAAEIFKVPPSVSPRSTAAENVRVLFAHLSKMYVFFSLTFRKCMCFFRSPFENVRVFFAHLSKMYVFFSLTFRKLTTSGNRAAVDRGRVLHSRLDFQSPAIRSVDDRR